VPKTIPNKNSHEKMITREYRNTENFTNSVRRELDKADMSDYLLTQLSNSRYAEYAKKYPECETIEDVILKGYDFTDNYKDNNMQYAIDLRLLDFIYIQVEYFDTTKDDSVSNFLKVIEWNKKEYGLADDEDTLNNYLNPNTTIEEIDDKLILIEPSSAGIMTKVVYQLGADKKIIEELEIYDKNLLDNNPKYIIRS
jgi:hypothetical protein